MRKTIKISLLLMSLALLGCKAKQPTSTHVTDKAESSTSLTKTLTIEFYSKGGGINHTAFSSLKALLGKQIEGVSCEFENKLVNYGREGERQYCMTFHDAKCYSAVLNLVNHKMEGKENVRIVENGTCHKNTR
jgi:hypothetical protein